MKIDKIKKMNSGKYKIILEDSSEITTYDEVILKHNLLYNKNIDKSDLDVLNGDTSYYDIYYKCVKYISKKLRSEKEIAKYLEKMNIDIKLKDCVIKELRKVGLINDKNFASSYVSDRFYLSSDGPNKIKKDLVEYGISDELIEDAMGGVELELVKEKVTKIINKKIKVNHKYSSFMLQKKITNDLLNLGYSIDMINTCYSSLSVDDSANLEQEFEKCYRKLSNRLAGDTLFLKIKQKLYQKGYSLADIDKLIEKKKSLL